MFFKMLDVQIFNSINNLAGQYLWLDTFAIFFAEYLPWILIVFLFLFLLKDFKRYWKMVFLGFFVAILTRGFVEIIRWFLPRPRPFIENNVNLLLSHLNVPSFPSGHAVFFFALSTIVYFYNKKIGILFFVSSLLIGFSRIFVGIHWPSDILAGALLGILCGLFIISILKIKIKSNIKYQQD